MITVENKIKRIGLGTVQFGLDYGISNPNGKVEFSEVNQLLKYSQKSGVQYLDSALSYGDALDVLGKHSIVEQFKVISKLRPGVQSNEVLQQVRESCDKLKQTSLNGMLVHWFPDYKADPSIYDELQKAKELRLVDKIGVSVYEPGELEFFFEQNHKADFVQLPLNVFDQRFLPYLQELKNNGVETHIRSAFLQGLFFMDPRTLHPHFDAIKNTLIELREMAEEYGLKLNALLLNFLLSIEEIDVVLLGHTQMNQLEANLNAALNFKPLETDWKRFEITNDQILLPYLWPKKK